jgi:mono/diheme cytochrome c family protein
MRNQGSLVLLVIAALLIAACGSVATPVPNSLTLEAQATQEAQDIAGDGVSVPVVVAPTSTPIPLPTDTSTPTEEPPTPTDVPPTEAPEVEEVEEDVETDLDPEHEQIVLLVSRFGDPNQGQSLFTRSMSTNMGEFACSICHSADSEAPGVGPGLWNLNERAGDRVEGMPAEVYAYLTIIEPAHYTVPGFAPGVMPSNYADILSDQEIYDLAAYVLSLGD